MNVIASCSQEERVANNIKKKLPSKKARRLKRKRLNKKGRKEIKKNTILSFTMSTWAENFTMASTWQIKHQLAFWKARAKALEYENIFLHKIIKEKHFATRTSETQFIEPQSVELNNEVTEDSESIESEIETETNFIELQNIEINGEEKKNSEIIETELEEDESNENFEVSEEFIQFLQANEKFKEDAKREREKFNSEDWEELKEEIEVTNPMTVEQYKEVYGDNWQKICALEISLTTDFMNKSDQFKPTYWPNIPFNFNCSTYNLLRKNIVVI